MYIQTNLLGINSINNNKKINKGLTKSIGKLSSGRRINIAADDAAGLSISEKMRGQIRGLKMASKNDLDAYSMMEVRDGVLDEVHHIMQRMRELTIQSLNDSLTDEDREKIQKEFRALQVAISDFTKKTEWNTKPAFEAHESSFYSFEGNQKFDNLVKILDGVNNDLQVSVDGEITEISIDEGYYTINEIADIIDDKLIEKNPNLIINLTERNNISLQSENSLSIDYIKGGLSFLFYEYHIGTPPGMIIGVTEFRENGKLQIISGKNDKLKFYVGASKEYTIEFSPKSDGYSIDELIDIINTQLKEKGENDVEAIKYSNKHIALCSDKYVITGLSGNMIKIDNITSVLYDNAKYGSVYKSQAYVTGSKDLSDGITITKDENDTLRMKINDETELKTINLLEESETEKNYALDELVNKINDEIENLKTENPKLDIIAKKSGNKLRIISNYYGSKSRVILDDKSNAYEDLFVGVEETILNPIVIKGSETSATIIGRYVLGDTIDIISGENDTLEITVDGVEKSIKIEPKQYTKEDLISEIDYKLKDNGLNATAKLLGPSSNGKYALSIKNNDVGKDTISISTKCNAYKPLFCEAYIINPQIKNGTTTWPQEGIVGDPIATTPANLTGRADLSKGVTIDETNDKLSFKMSGNEIEITLDHGKHDVDQLRTMISEKLFGKGVEVSLRSDLGYGTNIVFTTEAKGEEQYFSDVGGTAKDTILAGTGYWEPTINSTGGITQSSITGRTEIGNNFVINDTNNKLSFTYSDKGIEYKIDITLENIQSINIGFIVNELNQKIYSKLQDKGLIGDEISASVEGQKIKISTKNSGSSYQLKDFSGGFYENVIKGKTINKIPPYKHYSYSNYKENQLAYIVGREDLNNKEMVIIHS